MRPKEPSTLSFSRLTSRPIGYLLVMLTLGGCSRGFYRMKADQEVYTTLAYESDEGPWETLPDFTIEPDSRSRFYDPTPAADPQLPIPSPQLYDYSLPELPIRDPARFHKSVSQSKNPALPNSLSSTDDTRNEASTEDEGQKTESNEPTVQTVSFDEDQKPTAPSKKEIDQKPEPEDDSQESGGVGQLRLVPIPKSYWNKLPPSCLRRMLEFKSVRTEYERSFDRPPSKKQRDSSQRLSLEDIVDLALINSRQYQTQKENLYQVALNLSFERYAYQLKFSAIGGGNSGANYTHNRNGGTTVNGLGIPTGFSGGKMLATGSDLLARFANDVVLTFNGPQGFAADVSSQLLLDVSHSVFQRDAVFERLTQAERNVIYAARDFARFRKTLFRDLAADYYALLLTYRRIEINADDYFTNLRAFNQGQAEYRAGRLPRVQVDQVEQNALTAGSQLISGCNTLEQALDNLKLTIGLPPEMPLNLNLMELEMLTLRDEITVSAELVRRARRNLATERGRTTPDRVVLLNAETDLTQKLISLKQLSSRLGTKQPDIDELETLLARELVDEMRGLVRFNREILSKDKREQPPKPPERILWRTVDLTDSLLRLARRQINLASRLDIDPKKRQLVQTQLDDTKSRLKIIRSDLEEATADQIEVAALLKRAEALLVDAEMIGVSALTLTNDQNRNEAAESKAIRNQVDQLLERSDQVFSTGTVGLAAVDIKTDDAMLTALVKRFDIMNARGNLADAWRQIKIAGDDLKSVLDLRATQTVRTRASHNRPFDFSFDESQTRLTLAFDTPLNRKLQRNTFRRTLISYQAALRSLIETEDRAKLAIRNDLRQLNLDREQYTIAVASAALAQERVVSTRLQLNLGVQGIATRDFLEAQRAFAASLNAVANEHIGYLRDRIQLFLDLELLEVDQNGFWPELYDENRQPEAYYQLPPYALPAYGKLNACFWYTKKMKRMMFVPTGKAAILNEQTNSQTPPPADTDAQDEAKSMPAPKPEEVKPEEVKPEEVLPPVPKNHRLGMTVHSILRR